MINYGLKDRVAIITGANNPQGIGAATALAFAREGAKVALPLPPKGKCWKKVVDTAIWRPMNKAFDITGLAESGVVLEIRFMPGTFMEHAVENSPYRRILIKARGCAPRDLWIKWTRLGSSVAFSVNDNVSEGEIVFENLSGEITLCSPEALKYFNDEITITEAIKSGEPYKCLVLRYDIKRVKQIKNNRA